MNEFSAILCHAKRFKGNVKELSIEQLEEVKLKLDKIIEDRTLELEVRRKGEAEHLEKIKRIQEIMAAEGVEASELQFSATVKAAKKAPRQPKYEINNAEGDRITWTGQGRMPNLFKNRLEQGEKIESFLIDS